MQRRYRTKKYYTSDEKLNAQIDKQRAILERIEKKKATLLDLLTDDLISKAEYKRDKDKAEAEEKEAKETLEELEQQRVSSEAHREHMAKIHAALKAAERDVANGKVTKEFIDTFIDKILVTPLEDGKMELDIRIFTGESTKKYLARLKSRASDESRTGQMSKKMRRTFEVRLFFVGDSRKKRLEL